MKTAYRTTICLVLFFAAAFPCSAEVQVWHQGIAEVSVNLRGAPVVLGQQSITTAVSGYVLVQFDGNCVSSDGDRILLAASDAVSWGVNDGHTAVEAYNTDVNRHSFSHSRRYSVGAGNHTFYAVGQNYVETSGNGIASVYASLTVKFFPNESGGSFVAHTGVVDVNHYVRGSAQVISQLMIYPSTYGEVLVRFDGMCVSDPGDLIVIAASNTTSWGVNDGNVGTEAINSDLNTRTFSHSRRYSVAPGLQSFYGVAQNFVETDGDGEASFYGSLTVEFFPYTAEGSFLEHVGVSETNVYVEGAPVTMGQLTINPTLAGTAVVRYEGLCASSPGDRVIMAASNTENWGPNDGNVNAEAAGAGFRYNNFSHTRSYQVNAGPSTFYAVCQNYVETAGNGVASNYASLSVEFFPDLSTSAVRDDNLVPAAFLLETNFPNPFNPSTSIAYQLAEAGFVTLNVYNLLGQNVRTLVSESQVAGRWVQQWDGKNFQGEMVPSGVYLYQLTMAGKTESRKMILMK